jgi:hypothetical protein
MINVFATLVAFTLLGSGVTARAESNPLENLDGETAFAEIAGSEGLVLVDLYADW